MYDALEQIALSEFGHLVTSVRHLGRRAGIALKLRLDLRDGTFADVWLSPGGNRYSYHWEQRAKRGLIRRLAQLIADYEARVVADPNTGEANVEAAGCNNHSPTADWDGS